MVNPPTRVVLPGPDGPAFWALPHRGRFRIADFGEYTGRVSMSLRMAADRPCFVTIWARWSRLVDETFTSAGPDTVGLGPVAIGDTGGEFGYRARLVFSLEAPTGATHWQPVLDWTSAPGSGLVLGTKVRYDEIYVPDNGYPLTDQRYLDGDQPGARWEGPRAASTSVYGVATPTTYGGVTLEPELVVEGGGAVPNLDLDDDLMI